MSATEAPFLVFGGEFATEPRGGMRDLLTRSATREEAVAWARGYLAGRASGGWVHVWDSEQRKEIWSDAEEN